MPVGFTVDEESEDRALLRRIVLAAMLLNALRPKYWRASGPPKNKRPPPRIPGKGNWLRIIGLVTTIAIIVFLSVGLITSYRAFREAAVVPAPPPDAGEVHLYFDRPGVVAYLEATITPDSYGGNRLDYFIDVGEEYLGDDVGFSIVSTGAARYTEVFPNGDPLPKKNGCSVQVHLALGNGLRCHQTRLSPGSVYSVPEVRVPTQVISGQIDRNDSELMFATLFFDTREAMSTHMGKRTYFRLPAIGTTYIPEDYRDEITFDLGDGQQMYVPAKLDVAVDYIDLEVTDRIENIDPQPYSTGELQWIGIDESVIQAYGSIVDTIEEDRAQRNLFLIGIFAGLATGALPILFTRVAALLSRTRRPPTSPSP